MRTTRLERRHRRGLALLVLAVLLVHAALLGGIDAPAPDGAAARPPVPVPAATVQVRTLAAEPAAVAAPALPIASVAAETAPVAAPARPKPQATRAPATPATALPAVVAAPAQPAEAPPPPAEAAAGTTELPIYPTQLPPAATLRYALRRGQLAGSGELRWSPEANGYELQLDAYIAGLHLLTQVSRGGIDAAGLAPQRFTDRRARRPAQAANFERTAGKVMFSGPAFELPLRAGVQDRLSWMIQLAAIAAADPRRLEAGALVTLQVVGARGDAGLWVFRCTGAEPLAGSVTAVHFVREARGPHDTAVEVWLDPARHHLPARATIRNGGEGEGLELHLRDLVIGG